MAYPLREHDPKRLEEEMPIGTKKRVNGVDKYWSGPDLGFQTKATFEKLKTEGYKGDQDYMLSGGWQARRAQLGINKVLEAATPVIAPALPYLQKAYETAVPWHTRKSLEIGGSALLQGLDLVDQGVTAGSRALGMHPFWGNAAIETAVELATPTVSTTLAKRGGDLLKIVDNLKDTSNLLPVLNVGTDALDLTSDAKVKQAITAGKVKHAGSTVFKTSDEWYDAAKKLHAEGLSAKQIRDKVGKFKDEATGQRWTIHQTGRGKGITRIDLDITRANREANNLRRAQEQTGDYFNAYKRDRGLKEQARLLDSPEGRGQIHHMRPKVVIDTILHGSTGTEREILLSLSHDVFGGIGDTLGNMQVLSHRNHKIVHAMLKENGFDQSVMKLQNFEKLTGAQRIEALYDLREVVLETKAFVFKKRAEDLAQELKNSNRYKP